jgi:hypothetical protein
MQAQDADAVLRGEIVRPRPSERQTGISREKRERLSKFRRYIKAQRFALESRKRQSKNVG